jgi:adenylosuccinate lyase
MLHRLTNMLDRLVVYGDRMKINLESTRGLFFSQRVLLALTEGGLDRDEAYRLTQRHAMAAWNEGDSFKDRLAADPDIMANLSEEELEELFDLNYYLKHVGTIFSQVFGEGD